MCDFKRIDIEDIEDYIIRTFVNYTMEDAIQSLKEEGILYQDVDGDWFATNEIYNF